MIGMYIKSGGNSLSISLPCEELLDHLMSIGINKNISIGGNDKVEVDCYADNDISVSQTICDRLPPTDRISTVNELCERVESAWRVGYNNAEKAIVEQNLHGAEEMAAAVVDLDIRAREEISMDSEISM